MQIERFHPTYGRVIFELSLDDDPAAAIARQIAQLKAAQTVLAPQGYTPNKSGGKMDISTVEIDAENSHIVLRTKWLAKWVNGQATKDVDIEGKKALAASVFGSIPNQYDKSKYTNYCPLSPENAWAIMQNITKIGLNDFDYSQLTMYLFGQQAPTPAPTPTPSGKPTPPANNPLNQQSTTKRRLPAAVPPDTSAPPVVTLNEFIEQTNICQDALAFASEIDALVGEHLHESTDSLLTRIRQWSAKVPPDGETFDWARLWYVDYDIADGWFKMIVDKLDPNTKRYTQRKAVADAIARANSQEELF